MKTIRSTFLIFLVCAGVSTGAHAQEDYSDLYVFGYMQTLFASLDAPAIGPHSTTFLLQQTNVMASKEFSAGFSSFLNIQFTNSYNSKLNWGNLNLEEGWAKYSYSSALNIKVGLIVPSFNAMLQVKDRTPLLPYVFRPFVYESIMLEQLNLEALLPVRANVEVYGSVPVAGAHLEYAAYVGNSESAFLVSGSSGYQGSGMDSTTFKLIGGRIGVVAPWLRAGVSMTSDKESHVAMGLGALGRYRYGADASVHLFRVTLDGEMILVRTTLGDREKGTLAMIRAFNPMVGEDFNRDFFYGTLLYDITDAVFGYGSYSFLRINEIAGMSDGIREWTVGGGWRPIDAVVVKAQYMWITSPNPFFNVKMENAVLAVSVMF